MYLIELSVYICTQITTTLKHNIMATTKTHLGMEMGKGKITTQKSSCGLGVFNRQGRWNHIVNT